MSLADVVQRFGLIERGGEQVALLGVVIGGEVVGAFAEMVITQRYRNDEPRAIEAIYTFPLPTDASVHGFEMVVGGKLLQGTVLERDAAFRVYDDALVAGDGAALLDQERPNVFTASVGNLLPGEETSITVRYLQPLRTDEGAIRLAVPTLVAPRYIPGAPSTSHDRTADGTASPTDRVPDADRISPRVGDVGYRVRLDLVWRGEGAVFTSPSHRLTQSPALGGGTRLAFEAGEVPLDRDLVVLAEPSRDEGGLEQIDAHRPASSEGEPGTEGFVAITLVPELLGQSEQKTPGTVVFVLDRSGSMSGDAMTEARRALSLCLRHLRPGDRFAILSFDTEVERLAAEPTVFSQRSLVAADAFLANVDARGGTELLAPLREAVTLAGTGGHVVLLTDGEVGNEDEIEREIVPRAQTAGVAIHAFAIGLNVSDTLLATLARQSGGALAHIYPGERIDEKVVQVFARATSPRVRDLTLTIEGVELADLAPATLPPYVDGEPFTLFGRYTVPGQGSVVLRGRLGSSSYVRRIALTLPAQAESRTVPLCWAKTRLRDLEESPREGRRGEAMKRRIVDLATRFQLASSETSFVVVEKRDRNRQVTTAAVARSIPVHAPATHADDVATFVGGARGGLGGGGFGGSARSMSMAVPMPMSASGFAFDGSAGAPPAPAPAMAAPPPPPPPPPGARAASPAKKMAPPPAPQGGAQEASRSARPVTPKAPSPAPVRARAESFDAEREEAIAASEGSASPTSAARLLETQRASGLFGADDGQVALTMTIGVLRACLAEGFTTSHAIYGEQIKRALDAALPLLDGPASDDKRALAALLVLLAEGRLTSRHIRAELTARPSAAAVIAALDDTAALRLLAGGSA